MQDKIQTDILKMKMLYIYNRIHNLNQISSFLMEQLKNDHKEFIQFYLIFVLRCYIHDRWMVKDINSPKYIFSGINFH